MSAPSCFLGFGPFLQPARVGLGPQRHMAFVDLGPSSMSPCFLSGGVGIAGGAGWHPSLW